MKKLLTTLALVISLGIMYGQHVPWFYEDMDSLLVQREEAWNLFDHYRGVDNYTEHLVAYYRDLAEWVDYKIECYRDSIPVPYEVYEIDGETYYGRADSHDPGIHPSYIKDTLVTEHRMPRYEEFKQYQLSRKHLLPITRDLRYPIPAAAIKGWKNGN